MAIRIDEVVATIESDAVPPPAPDPNSGAGKPPDGALLRREFLRLQERAARLFAD